MLHEWLLKYYPCALQACVRKGQNRPFFRFFWVPSLIAMRNFRNGMVLKKTMSRARLLLFPTHFHQVFFFSLKNKNSYFEWFILRSQSVQLSC